MLGLSLAITAPRMTGDGYGPEFVTNGSFDTGDLTGWTDLSGSNSVASGEALLVHNGSDATITQSVPVEIGASYEVLGKLTNVDAVAPRVKVGTSTYGAQYFQKSANGDFAETVVATTTDLHITLQVLTGGSAKFDNFSVRKVL